MSYLLIFDSSKTLLSQGLCTIGNVLDVVVIGKEVVGGRGKLDLPSDIQGLLYIPVKEDIKNVGEDIRKEVQDFLPPGV